MWHRKCLNHGIRIFITWHCKCYQRKQLRSCDIICLFVSAEKNTHFNTGLPCLYRNHCHLSPEEELIDNNPTPRWCWNRYEMVFSGLVIFGNLQSSDIMVWGVIRVWRVGCNQVKTAPSLGDNRCQIEDKHCADHWNCNMLQDNKFLDFDFDCSRTHSVLSTETVTLLKTISF